MVTPVRTIESTDGVEIALHRLDGEGAPLLLAHATGFHAMVMAPLASRLDGFGCWAPDMRGHGDSVTPPDTSFDWAGFRDDILAVVDAIGAERISAVGHSMGGAALLLAEQARPGTFEALYLYEPVVFPPDVFTKLMDENPMSAAARRRRRSFDSVETAIENFAAKPPMNAFDDDVLRAYVDHGFIRDADGTIHIKCDPEHEAAIYMTGGTHDAFAHLGEVGCPVTVAAGNNTVPGPGLLAGMIADELPDSRLVTFEDLGHFGPLEDPAAVAASVLEAFGR